MELNIDINHISETALITLYCHAIDAKSKNSILKDHKSIKTTNLLNKELSKTKRSYHKRLVSENIDPNLVRYISLRAKKYDNYVKAFITNYPDATVVNIGCGFDFRFERVDNGSIKYFDLDLSDIINIKKQLFNESDRYQFISQSVFDYSWFNKIENTKIIFLAEGVFMYCPPEDVKSLFIKLTNHFSGSEMVCEMMHKYWISGFRKKIVDLKMHKGLRIGKNATFLFGINNSHEPENWNSEIKLIDDWSVLDTKNIGWLSIFRKIPLFRNFIWTTHYRLGT